MIFKSAEQAWKQVAEGSQSLAVYQGDCMKLLRIVPDNSTAMVLTSPPYCMGKEYEPGNKIEDFIEAHEEVLPEIARLLKPGGSVCWQTGYHVAKNTVMPLDYLVLDIVRRLKLDLTLRNRVVWHFGHGMHTNRRFSGRHEVIMWFTKGDDYHFDLDAVREPQKYPGKRSTRSGKPSGNPLGKNPADVWDIPNVKSNHVEKLDHPCQFPIALARRLIRAMTKLNDIVLDPYCGVGSTGGAAHLEQRRFLGAEIIPKYAKQANKRLIQAEKGEMKFRPDVAVHTPSPNSILTKRPEEWSKLAALT